MRTMEPTTSSGVAGIFAWKLIGGLAGVGAIGAGLAAIVVMCVLRPRTQQEWTVGLICTVLGSVSGGSAFIMYFELQHWANSALGLAAMIGVIFACGLPAWAIVRWVFNYVNKREGHDITQIVDELRKKAAGVE
jgi:hypothetical protein